MPPGKWKVISRDRDRSHEIVTVRTDRAVSPRTGISRDFFILETPPWVNIIPVTPERMVVLIRQYRHGTGEVALEIPGGMVEAGDTPESAALRELKEETGYAPGRIWTLGSVRPNPAIQDTVCHTYLAADVVRVSEPALDEGEDIEVVLTPLAEIPGLIRRGEISHALVIVAFYRFYMEHRGQMETI